MVAPSSAGPPPGGKRLPADASHPSLVHRTSGTCSSLLAGLEKLRRPRKTAKGAEMRRRSGSVPAVAIFTSADSGDVSGSRDGAAAAESRGRGRTKDVEIPKISQSKARF